MGSALSVKNYESPADRRLAGGFLADTRYQKSHSESKFPIFINMFFLLDAPHFWGMILVENLGYSTPVLSLSLFSVKSYSPSPGRVKHYYIQDFEVFFFRLRSLQLLCQVEIISANQRTQSWANRLLSVLSTGKSSWVTGQFRSAYDEFD